MSEVASPRPALGVLVDQQKELIDHRQTPMTGLGCSLRHGFDSRQELIVWYQAAVVRTFGAFAERMAPNQLGLDRVLLTACITSDRRERWELDGKTVPAETAAKYRRAMEQNELLPATNEAYNALRKMAGEYLGKDAEDITGDLSHDRQEIAMRPAFSRKDLEQREALKRLWEGFATTDEIRDWLHDLDQPTNGALASDFASRIMADTVAQRYLLRGRVHPEYAQVYREWLAISKLLPAFVTGIERMDAGELAKRTREGLEAAQG